MNRYLVEIQIDESELEASLEELEQAIEKIRTCYGRLKEMGVLTVREESDTTSCN